MITPVDIQQKVARLYVPFLHAWLSDQPFFPLDFPVGKLPSDYLALREGVRVLQAKSKEQRGYGYTLDYQVQQKHFSGQQTVPVRIIIATEQDFLQLVEKKEEFDLFRHDVALIREQLPQLEAWMIYSPKKVIEQHRLWPDLLAVCRYFLEHPRPNLYLRELPINIHTKFIEQHRACVRELLEQILPPESISPDAITFEQRFGLREKESPVRFRLLDGQLYNLYHLPLTDMSVPASQFSMLDLLRGQCCVVTENEMTFLTLPPHKDTFALFGGGFMVRNLKSISWLAECPILYWGDLDAQGFQILASLRALFPHVTSLMMDWETFSAFAEFCVAGTPGSARQLPHLHPDEHALFLHLTENNLRLEQEHISHSYAMRQLQQAIQQSKTTD
ncbi:MAG TPA: Wadjet anti-phage system protein JetD domain-containing protein [Ktedonobacteraceae bacterium]|nr:Wadjet anti-phage system protein JetD domain-containing protein [Ktedonobacteraceae bacterium]